jgi:hypothetical protein
MASPSPSHSWGDGSDALARLIPSLPSQSSDSDAGGCWGGTKDALADFVTPLSGSASDEGFGGAGDALEYLVAHSESPSDAWGCAGDILELMLPSSPVAFQQDPMDLLAPATDADHWLNSDGEEDSGVQSPTKCHLKSPPQSASSFDSQSHSDYAPSTDEHISNPSPRVFGHGDLSPRKHTSEEDLFIGMELDVPGFLTTRG